MNNGVYLKSNTLFRIPFSPTSPLLHPNKTHHSFFSIQLPKHKLVSFHVKIPSVSPVFASKTPTKGEISISGTENFDFEDEFDEEFEEDEDEDEDIIVPLKNMRQWNQNKPRGFGEGKVYDTSIEDKLLEEFEQSRVAQVANINNLKNSPENENPNSKKGKLQKQKVPEVVPNCVRVRLVNLPKKKNIHRDLQVAFKQLPGIINIIPAVSGNKKTREPVCKGFAFVDFKSEKEANRFVDMFSTQLITFGKVQKQIKCEIMKSRSPNPASVKPSIHRTENPAPVSNPSLAINSNPALETTFDSFVEDAAFDKFKNGDDDLVSATEDHNDDNIGNLDDVIQEKHKSETVSESSKKQKKVGEKGKKVTTAKRKGEKTPKLNIPGSANRLKMKEKALLSGVFSKYGGNSATATTTAMAAKGTEVITDQVQ